MTSGPGHSASSPLQRWRDRARLVRERLFLPALARGVLRRDLAGLPSADPGSAGVQAALIDWLCAAQDHSASADGGVARSYDLKSGWETSYPETTGYIVPTFIDCAQRFARPELAQRARRMVDWLVSIQLPEGGFQGGRIDSVPVVPVTFNTGQILLGLAAAVRAFGAYQEPMHRAADWLVRTQDADGCWRRYPTPFAAAGEKEYETHVAWGLFEAARIDATRGYGEAGLRNVRWALSSQREDGWLPKCCLDDPTQPLTHTIGYALRGTLEAHLYSPEPALLGAARRIADGLLQALEPGGRLPGRLREGWKPAAEWVCLTGAAQVAICWLMLWRLTGERRYVDAAFQANTYVRRSVSLQGGVEVRGGVAGSFPIDGDYGRYQYLNWAAKFLLDGLVLEQDVRAELARR